MTPARKRPRSSAGALALTTTRIEPALPRRTRDGHWRVWPWGLVSTRIWGLGSNSAALVRCGSPYVGGLFLLPIADSDPCPRPAPRARRALATCRLGHTAGSPSGGPAGSAGEGSGTAAHRDGHRLGPRRNRRFLVRVLTRASEPISLSQLNPCRGAVSPPGWGVYCGVCDTVRA